MTKDKTLAEQQAVAYATKSGVTEYIYLLRDGHYYISQTPPYAMNAEYVARACPEIPGDAPRIRA